MNTARRRGAEVARPPRHAAPTDIDIACQALQALRQQLSSLASMGGGDVSEGLLQAASDDCPEAVLVTDREAQIVMVNGVAARLLGTSTRELQRLTVWDLTHMDSQGEFDVLWREFLRAGRQRGVLVMRKHDTSAVEVAYCGQTDVLPNRLVVVLRRRTH